MSQTLVIFWLLVKQFTSMSFYIHHTANIILKCQPLLTAVFSFWVLEFLVVGLLSIGWMLYITHACTWHGYTISPAHTIRSKSWYGIINTQAASSMYIHLPILIHSKKCFYPCKGLCHFILIHFTVRILPTLNMYKYFCMCASIFGYNVCKPISK